MKIMRLNLIGLVLLMLTLNSGVAQAINFPVNTIPNIKPKIITPQAVLPNVKRPKKGRQTNIRGCPKLVAQELHIVRVDAQPVRSGVPTYRFILDGTLKNTGFSGLATAGLNVSRKQNGRVVKREALQLFKQHARRNQSFALGRNLHVTVQSEAISRTDANSTTFELSVLNLRNEQGNCSEYNPTIATITTAQIISALPSRLRGKISQKVSTLNRPRRISPVRPRAMKSKTNRPVTWAAGKPLLSPGATVEKSRINRPLSSRGTRSLAEKTRQQPIVLNKGLLRKLKTGRATKYLVLIQKGGQRNMRNPVAGRTSVSLYSWTGKILLPNLAKKAKPVRIMLKGEPAGQYTRSALWVLKNPDGSLSKQIKNVNGRLVGNTTITRDGSLRIGLDLTGNQEADLYEMMTSDGEHSLLASPAGKAALDHFMNGGKNPLCNSGATGGNSSNSGFAGGMISGEDKTAMQVVCGRKSHSPSNGGSAAGGSNGISGDPGGRATDAMCRSVLRRHRGRPGNPGQVMGDHDDALTAVSAYQTLWNAVTGEISGSAADALSPAAAANAVKVLKGTSFVLGALIAVGTSDNNADRATGVLTTAIGIASAPAAAFISVLTTPSHTSGEADERMAAENERNYEAPDCDPNTTSCGPITSQENSGDNTAGTGGGGNTTTDPGPDQQNDPDAGLLSMCQARAKAKAWWASNTKDTRYVQQLCANPASQPNPAGKAGSATLGGSYGSSITLATYCGKNNGQGTPAPSPENLANNAGSGRNCGPTESPGTDGQCRGVGHQFGIGNGRHVNVTYGALIGFTPFNPALDPPPGQ